MQGKRQLVTLASPPIGARLNLTTQRSGVCLTSSPRHERPSCSIATFVLVLDTMRLPFFTTAILFYLTNCLLTLAMHISDPRGWHFYISDSDRRLKLQDRARVYAWPSTGGRLELQNPSAFELDMLGITDHFTESNKSTDATEEDSFVLKFRRLGGTFYQYKHGVRHGELEEAEIHTWLGWPEDEEHKGGVWVLKLTWTEMRKRSPSRMTARIGLATTMQDRCRAIEMCGGTFYANPTDEHLVSMEPMPDLGEPGFQEILGLE